MKNILLLSLFILASCASSKPGPIVQHDKITDQATIAADKAYCESQAVALLDQQAKKGQAAKGALGGSARGAAGAAVGSAIYGGNSSDRKRAAKYGAALGAASGAANAKRKKESVKRNIQAECLVKKGYKIYGWN